MINKKILFTSSAGGHYAQLIGLIRKLDVTDYLVLTEKTKVISKDTDNTVYLFYGSTNEKLYFVKLIINFFKSFAIFLKFRPDFVISTGVHSTIPIMIISKLFNVKVIYIESFAKVYTGTRTGLFVYKHKLYDYFIVQWSELLEVYPKAIYGGSLY